MSQSFLKAHGFTHAIKAGRAWKCWIGADFQGIFVFVEGDAIRIDKCE